METVVHESTKMYALVDRIALKSTIQHQKNIKIGLGVVEAASSSLVTQTKWVTFQLPIFLYIIRFSAILALFQNAQIGACYAEFLRVLRNLLRRLRNTLFIFGITQPFLNTLCYALNCNLFVNYVVMGLANTRNRVIIIVPLIRRIII